MPSNNPAHFQFLIPVNLENPRHWINIPVVFQNARGLAACISKSIGYRLILFAFLAFSPFLLAESKTVRVLVFGDSLSAAYNMKLEQGWASLLERELNQSKPDVKQFEFYNASISGETTSGGLRRFPKALKQSEADIVILELGANDGLRGFDLSVTQSNLAQMIKLARQQNAKVILAGMQILPNYGRTYSKRFSELFQTLGSQPGVTLIPFFLQGVAGDSSLIQADGLHPNTDAQPIIKDLVKQYLTGLI